MCTPLCSVCLSVSTYITYMQDTSPSPSSSVVIVGVIDAATVAVAGDAVIA